MMTDSVKEKVFGSHISGETSAWTYYSVNGSHFGMHLEDADALSFNVNLTGDVKFWVVVMPEDKQQLENVIKSANMATFEDILRHKQFYFPMSFLNKNHVRYYAVPQRAGYIILTLPRAYHQGFSMGWSINVAVNMLCSWWIEYGMAAKHVSNYVSFLLVIIIVTFPISQP